MNKKEERKYPYQTSVSNRMADESPQMALFAKTDPSIHERDDREF